MEPSSTAHERAEGSILVEVVSKLHRGGLNLEPSAQLLRMDAHMLHTSAHTCVVYACAYSQGLYQVSVFFVLASAALECRQLFDHGAHACTFMAILCLNFVQISVRV